MGCMFSQEPQDENVDKKDNEKDGEKKNNGNNGKKGNGSDAKTGGWPSWLASVAGEAIDGWLPRTPESFEKLEKIGQGTYSSVYKARDIKTDKIVAMKKVRFVNMEPLSVRFMAREIIVLRKLDHPNVMKLECIVTSRMSSSLYLVFEYMEHDLAGLAATPGITLTEPQIKCYMQQLFRGIEHCHSRGVLHRDLKGSNLLIDDNGILKIADFGLGTTFQVGQKQPLTSRVVTLWYRAPELLLGETEYGIGIDLWSAGCILAELFFGKPIMPGRTEVEQMHKIFKLCGSPSEEYWQKTKLPQATSFKPQQPYRRCLDEIFKNFPQSALSLVDKLLSMEPEDRGSADSALKSEFFTTEPLPSDPSDLPKYPPCKELDVKLRCEEARRKRAEAVKGRGAESVRRGSVDFQGMRTPEFIAQGQSKTKIANIESGASGFRIDPHKVAALKNGLSQSTSMIHPSAVTTWNKEGPVLKQSLMPREAEPSDNKEDTTSNIGPASTFATKKNRFHCSGPLMPPGGNIDDMLKEHEKQIQQAVRKARLEKA